MFADRENKCMQDYPCIGQIHSFRTCWRQKRCRWGRLTAYLEKEYKIAKTKSFRKKLHRSIILKFASKQHEILLNKRVWPPLHLINRVFIYICQFWQHGAKRRFLRIQWQKNSTVSLKNSTDCVCSLFQLWLTALATRVGRWLSWEVAGSQVMAPHIKIPSTPPTQQMHRPSTALWDHPIIDKRETFCFEHFSEHFK